MADRLREELASISAKVEEAKQRGAPIWPLNEANTERIVIEPVLKALGYGDLDYMAQPQGVGADYPDYIVLPGLDQRWILEVKQLDARLDERHERQAVNYANNNGAQWAVLTNGRTWWIYNTRVPGDLTQQRVYQLSDLFDETEAETLRYLSRKSMEVGELDRAYRAREIQAALKAELVGGNRRVARLLQELVGQRLDRNVSRQDIQDAVRALLHAERVAPQPESRAAQSSLDAVQDQDLSGWHSLAFWAEDQRRCTNAAPEFAKTQQGTAVPTNTWRDVARFVLLDAGLLREVSLPVRAGRNAKRYFVNWEPVHATGAKMKAPFQLESNGRAVYAELHYSAYSLCHILVYLLREASMDPESILVKVRADSLAQT